MNRTVKMGRMGPSSNMNTMNIHRDWRCYQIVDSRFANPMDVYTCVYHDRQQRYNSRYNRIMRSGPTCYYLANNHRQLIVLSGDELSTAIKYNRIQVNNIRIDSLGRIYLTDF